MVAVDESSEATRRLSDRITEAGALVPELWHLEVANGLLVAERRKQISAEDRGRAMRGLAKSKIEIDPSTSRLAWLATLTIAETYNLTVYDASYLELALRRSLPLATLDADLIRAGPRAGATLLQWL